MAINLNNVNISLDEFQRISSGWYNAGEVKLRDANTLGKINHHVATWWYDNKDAISHAETVAIKQALVKALSQNGVQGEALARARQKLGLQPMDPSDKSLLKRSVTPLTRQQIREILDENAETLNQTEGHGRIRTQAELDAEKSDRGRTKSAAGRAKVNAELAARTEFHVNTEIARFERVISDFADFTSAADRAKMLEIARAQLDALLVACDYRPRPDHVASAEFQLQDGPIMTVSTGLSEVEFAERLENMIVRFENKLAGPDEAELEVVSRHRQCKSHNEQLNFLNSLPQDPKFGLKARALAVRALYSRKITDYATLAQVNRLSAQNALNLARVLLDLPADTTPGQIRANHLGLLAAVEPGEVPEQEQAYIPATSNTQYNKFVFSTMTNPPPERMLPAHRHLAMSTKELVRQRLGAVAMPENTQLENVFSNPRLARLNFDNDADWEANRNTAENIRQSYLAAALDHGAGRIVMAELQNAIVALGGDPREVNSAANGLKERCPDLIRRLTQANSPEQAQAAIEDFREAINRQASLYCKALAAANGIVQRTRQTIAGKLGIDPAVIAEMDRGIIRVIGRKKHMMMASILSGEVPANTDAEVDAAFKNMMDGYVTTLTDHLDAVDALNPPLLPHVADQVKLIMFNFQKLDDINVAFIAEEVPKRVHTANLEQLLKTNADKGQIQQALLNIRDTIDGIVADMLAGNDEIGPDDRDGIRSIGAIIAIRSRPGLADRLDAFLLRPDVKADLATNLENRPEVAAMEFFHEFSFHPEVCEGGPRQAAEMHDLFAAPREMAAFKAAGGEPAALQAGYHAKDMAMLARAFTLVRAARNLTDQAAMDEILDPVSRSRRLFGYGGRFLETPENFRRGLELMERFHDWRTAQGAAYEAGNRNTPTLVNVRANVIHGDAERGLEKFVLEEIAANPVFALDEADDDKLFAMQHNRAMRFVGLNYASSGYGTLSAIPPAKRGLVYDVVDLLRGPLANTMEEKEGQSDMSYTTILLARILKNYDELEELRVEGQFDRAHVIQLLFGDLDVQATDTAGQIDDAIFAAVEAMPPLIGFAASNLMSITGDTAEACRTALEQGQRLPNAPYVVTGSAGLEGIGTAEAARKALLDDLERIQNVGRLPEDEPILNEEQLHFVFRFPGAEPLVSRWSGSPEEVQAANSVIVDKLAGLCGRAHPEQFSAVCYALSQSGAGANVRSAFNTHNISSSEHMPLTFAITRSNETGAIEIVCSEPEGFPLRFHWTTTVALDGTVTSTPMVIEQPAQPENP